MSGVYARSRTLSSYEFYTQAIALRATVTQLVVSSAIPKSYRFVLAVPLAETARSLVYNLVKADAFYPNTEANVAERKRYMTFAVADCEQMIQDLQTTYSLGCVSAGRFESLVTDIESEIGLIKGARHNVKLIGKG